MVKLTKERKILVIAGGILLLAGLVYRLTPDVKAVSVSQDEIFLKEKRIQKYRLMVQKQQGFEAKLMELNRALARMENSLIKGKTQALAQVDIQNIINDVANRAGIRIDSMRILKTKEVDDGHFIVIPVELNCNTTISKLADMLYRIESSERILWISNLNARVAMAQNRSEPLAATITIAGLMKKTDESVAGSQTNE